MALACNMKPGDTVKATLVVTLWVTPSPTSGAAWSTVESYQTSAYAGGSDLHPPGIETGGSDLTRSTTFTGTDVNLVVPDAGPIYYTVFGAQCGNGGSCQNVISADSTLTISH
jgi:hypothetical protein